MYFHIGSQIDEKKGVADKARSIAHDLDKAAAQMIEAADDDAKAYARLQLTWKKDSGLSDEAVRINDFLPDVNKNIRSDACVALHLLAGAAHAAYATVLVNNPPIELKAELTSLLRKMREMEVCTDTA
ncbi:hypothetical protein SARC_05311 [Sphaeroforma arctica JP610]|uniref:Uncharacterized protein n=1 Tax=Sphaeroforma arctica JP610 TaxID=667725 RepID=A0A0L0G020_9EUKA|nr:hypothetical protein SARC_05311 [Sphaeroforma arctica JP610]KNC82415.1 hypothetical protein SARC_05311 [Sphaeroforma arctica JP610]|eukprot:XP_014156317.1 hypothetical protein SARC_05311 [Sphaeroforma arctica JP610]